MKEISGEEFVNPLSSSSLSSCQSQSSSLWHIIARVAHSEQSIAAAVVVAVAAVIIAAWIVVIIAIAIAAIAIIISEGIKEFKFYYFMNLFTNALCFMNCRGVGLKFIRRIKG
jgi:hypothetical protein